MYNLPGLNFLIFPFMFSRVELPTRYKGYSGWPVMQSLKCWVDLPTSLQYCTKDYINIYWKRCFDTEKWLIHLTYIYTYKYMI